MSIKSLKNLIFSFTDFEFLGSINLVDFEKKKVDIKKEFFNRLIGCIKQHVEVRTSRQLQILINNVKMLYIQRLAFVNTGSFFKYFFKNIKIAFQSFSRRLNRYFGANVLTSTGKRSSKRKVVQKNEDIEIPDQQPEEPQESETEESNSESETEEESEDESETNQPPPLSSESESEEESEEEDTFRPTVEGEQNLFESSDEEIIDIIVNSEDSTDESDLESVESNESAESNVFIGTGLANFNIN